MDANDGPGALTSDQIKILIVLERTGAGLSMGAIVLTMLSFALIKKIRDTSNVFLVFASLANAGASVASMIGYDGLRKGEGSDLCKAQAFLFEWFMQSDPWWSFAMAFNVFIVFFFDVNPDSFRKWAWAYCLICFGGPLIPAIVIIRQRGDPRGAIFGDAAMWCWISNDWSLVRLYAFYIPVWICIVGTLLIYIAVGFRIFRHRTRFNKLFQEGSNRGSVAANIGRPSAETSAAASMVSCEMPAVPPQAHIAGGDGGQWRARQVSVRRPSLASVRSGVMTRLRGIGSAASLRLKKLDHVKMHYLRASSVFAAAILITWIPSSLNRVYSMTHGGRVSFPLSLASGSVLPLQGVWNAIIFFLHNRKIVIEHVRAGRKIVIDHVRAGLAKIRRREAPGISPLALPFHSRVDILGYENRMADQPA